MGRFIFTYEGEIFDGPDKSITLEVGEDVCLDDLLNEIQNFLRCAGYYFDDYSYLDLVSRDKKEQPEVNDWTEEEWVAESKEDLFWQKDGQQWQSNGWEHEPDVDGPTEFAFNGTSEKDFDVVGSDRILWDPPNTVGNYKREG
jgi:hypothetical protein